MDVVGLAQDLWSRIFSWEWLAVAAVIAVGLSLLARGLVSTIVMAIFATVLDALSPIALGALLAGGTLPADLPGAARALLLDLPPEIAATKFALYLGMIGVCVWSRRDMLRPYEPAH